MNSKQLFFIRTALDHDLDVEVVKKVYEESEDLMDFYHNLKKH
jgi:hypothetical protein